MSESVLQANPAADVRVLFVWSPILAGDDQESAAKLARELEDPRARFFWDAGTDVGKVLAPTVDVGEAPFAWDVYCLYSGDAEWGDRPPDPTRWAHQLQGADPEHYFGGKLAPTLRAWIEAAAGGVEVTIPPARPTDLITVRIEDIRPLSEVLLEKILDDLAEDGGATDPAALEAIRRELLERMTEATRPYVDRLPKAIRHGDQILVVPEPDCADLILPQKSGHPDRSRKAPKG